MYRQRNKKQFSFTFVNKVTIHTKIQIELNSNNQDPFKINSFTNKRHMIKNIQPKIIVLHKDIPQNLLLQIDINQFHLLNNQDQWCINGPQFQQSTITTVFSLSQQINISTLVIKNKPNHLFLYRILSPKFQNLTFLKLCDNFLISIEPLSFINAPNLSELNIGGNRISSLRPLVKLPSHSVDEISIDKNNLINPQNFFKYLSRCPLGGGIGRVCQMFKLQTKSIPQEGYPSLQCQDLSFIAKLYCQFLMDLKFLFSTRIQQQTVRQCRRRKNLIQIPHYGPIHQ